MTAAMELPRAMEPLPFSLDLHCPIILPARPTAGTAWPYDVAGPNTLAEEQSGTFVKRRYLETLLLSDVLAPIPHFVQDVLRSKPNPSPDDLSPLFLSLSQIEHRHRKVFLPVISTLISASTHRSEVQRQIIEDALSASNLSMQEREIMKVALELRMGSHAVSEGAVIQAKKTSDELEKRETLIQIAMLFVFIGLRSAPADQERPKKRRKEHRKRNDDAPTVAEDPTAALELLTDRLSVWSAVAELGLNVDEPSSSKVAAGDNVQTSLRAFWDEVIVAFFIKTQPTLCASFHQKVFGKPIPPELLPAPAARKSRKPTITKPNIPSNQDSHSHPTSHRSQPMARVPSRAPSDTSSRMSPPPQRDRSLSRTLSRASESLPEFSRSRSQSIDLERAPAGLAPPKKGLVRAPSGKDLFKGRQVGFIRRTSSVIVKQQSLGLGRSESQGGLLGRKTSDPKRRRDSSESQSQVQAQAQSTQSQPGTLIFATPSKPRLANSIFGPRLGQQGFAAPTPIREEPRSMDRPSIITETPVAPGRISHATPGGVAETPIQLGRDLRTMFDGPPSTHAGNNGVVEEDEGYESDDPLGELMVMTDEEDGDEPDQEGFAIPETPATARFYK